MLKRLIGIGLKKKKSNQNEKVSIAVDNHRCTNEEGVVVPKYDGIVKSFGPSIQDAKMNNKISVALQTSKHLSSNLSKGGIKKSKRKSKSKEEKFLETNKVKNQSKNVLANNCQKSHAVATTYSKLKSFSKKKKKSVSRKEVKKEITTTKYELVKEDKSSVKKNLITTPLTKISAESKLVYSSKLEKESKLPKEPKPLAEGTMIAFNWEIKKTLGKGSFGQVYLAEHTQTHVKIAIKTLLASYQEFRIAMERDVLKLCSEKMYFPKVYLSGMHDIYYCIGMSLLGPSLTEVRKSRKTLKIQPQYCMIVCKQMVCALKTLHELGYVHRDIKPSNICTGYPKTPEAKNMCYLIDFGIVRKFIIGGVIIQPKGKGRLRGTMRYLSLNCHQLLELGPADDLHSLYYSIVELGTGQLPWRSCVDIKEVEKMKREFDFSKHRGDLSDNFHEFWISIKDITGIQFPDYAKCLEVVEKCIPNEYKGDNFIFPWHDNPMP